MRLNEYMRLAARTDSEAEKNDQKWCLLTATMGMVGESAEALDHMKKVVEQGHEVNQEMLIEEAGDTLWYIAKLARNCGITLEDLARRNIRKLQRRYPDGFSREKSIHREG